MPSGCSNVGKSFHYGRAGDFKTTKQLRIRGEKLCLKTGRGGKYLLLNLKRK